MDGVSILGRVVLAAVFALAGIAKLVDRVGTIKSLAAFGVPPILARPFGVLLPLAELICAIALIPARSAAWGASGVLALLGLFSAAISINLTRGRTPECHCFGQLHSEPIGWPALARNVVLGGISALIIWQPAPSMVNWTSAAIRGASVSTVLAGVAAAVAVVALYMVFQVLRQSGRLLVRLEAVEARLGMTPGTVQPAGLPVDSNAPTFRLRDLDGGTVTFDMLGDRNKPLLLVFTEPRCDACDALLPDITLWQREFADRLSTVIISRGTVGQNRNKRAKYELETVLLQTDREIAEQYRVVATPSAVLILHGKIARPMATGPDAIRSLVGEVTAVRVSKGDALPGIKLMDLRGEEIDLSRLRGARKLLLFWNPACGYCQKMLDEVKFWESHPRKGATELIVISSGSAEANAGQGFRSRLLLDDDFAAGQALGVTGTPSAILLDEHGKVSSDIAVGQESVMALARTRG